MCVYVCMCVCASAWVRKCVGAWVGGAGCVCVRARAGVCELT